VRFDFNHLCSETDLYEVVAIDRNALHVPAVGGKVEEELTSGVGGPHNHLNNISNITD